MIPAEHQNLSDPAERFRLNNLAAEERAAATVASMNLPSELKLSGEFNALGHRTDRFAKEQFGRLLELHGDRHPYIVGIAVREMWFAAWSAAHFMRISSDQGAKSSARLWTAEGYVELNGGFAYTLYNELANLTPAAARLGLLSETPYTESPDQQSLLLSLGLYWFAKANESALADSPVQAYEFLHEGYQAFAINSEARMWDDAFKFGKEDGADEAKAAARSAWGKTAAIARHAENRAMKQDVFRWCDEHMTVQLSMDAAASRVAGTVVPAAWRTVRDWITEWKKLRSAGTA